MPQPSIILAILFAPFKLLYKILAVPIRFFTYIFPFLRTFPRNPTTGTLRRVNTSGRRPLSPADAAQRVQREFTEEHGENELPWTNNGYATSLDQTKREYGFLLVVLISPEHDDITTFCSDVLMNPEVTSFLRDPTNTIKLWIGDVRDSEAYQVSTALKCTKFPFTALICNTPEVSSTAISVVSRITGPMEPSAYLAKLRSAHSARASQLETGRVAHNLQNSERNLRAEQDSAYERSLAQDRERARQRREAEAEAARVEKAKRDEEHNAAVLAEKRLQWRKWRAANIKPEPGPEEQEIVRIALKMPEAARVMRKFRSEDSIDELYAFVECYDLINGGEGSSVAASEKQTEKPTGYDHRYNFQIVSTLPRVVYGVEGGGTLGEKVGRSGNLIVEEIVDGDEDEGS
jgi:FAS-associated factor 2